MFCQFEEKLFVFYREPRFLIRDELNDRGINLRLRGKTITGYDFQYPTPSPARQAAEREASVKAGRTRNAAAPPPIPEAGSQPSCTENSRIIRMPSQKFGIDSPDRALIGHLLRDTWRIESFVARGSMGSVYRGIIRVKEA